MKVEIITEINSCQSLWNKFAPKNKLWDEWSVAVSFYEEGIYELYFMLFKDDNDEEIGLLPLYKYNGSEVYYFFGEGYPEMREFWFDIELLPEVIELMPKPTKIFDMKKSFIDKVLLRYPEIKESFKEVDNRYFLDLKEIDYELDKYLHTFGKKHKKNLLYDLNKLKEQTNYELKWEELEHLDEFVKFNIERFGAESDLTDKQFLKEMKTFLKAVKDLHAMHTLTIIINGKIEGIEIAAFYMNKYYVLNGGYNREIKNLGKLLIFEHIKKSLELKADEIDLLVGDTGWKKLWNFKSDECYTFKKE